MKTLLRQFIRAKSTSVPRYFLEQALYLALQMIPTVVGLCLRSLAYRLLFTSDGPFGLEENVSITHAANLHLGRNAFVARNCFLGASDGGIHIADNAVVLDGCYLNVFNHDTPIGSRIELQENSVLATGCVVHGHSGFVLGAGSIVGPGSTFITASHGSVKRGDLYRNIGINYNTSIIVGRNVWIGANVTVLPGTKIGDNSIIGAGSVVTSSIPEDSIYLGNPAKLHRKIV